MDATDETDEMDVEEMHTEVATAHHRHVDTATGTKSATERGQDHQDMDGIEAVLGVRATTIAHSHDVSLTTCRMYRSLPWISLIGTSCLGQRRHLRLEECVSTF